LSVNFHLNQVSIPIEDKNDKILWMHATSGDLSLKKAYQHFTPSGNIVSWAKLLWNLAIPPSESFMVWRLLHNKLATDENLAIRGFHLPSMCSLCNKEPETSIHLFLHCPFALSLWHWLASVIKINIDLSSFVSVLNICNRGWRHPQCKVTIAAAVIYIYNAVWNCRNQYRYQNIKPNLKSIISFISASISLAGSYINLVAGTSMTDFGADKLASLGVSLDDYTWWSSPPLCIIEELTRNRLGLPSFRFC
jgi:hypothetical protein